MNDAYSPQLNRSAGAVSVVRIRKSAISMVVEEDTCVQNVDLSVYKGRVPLKKCSFTLASGPSSQRSSF